jgi:hypothetical protein
VAAAYFYGAQNDGHGDERSYYASSAYRPEHYLSGGVEDAEEDAAAGMGGLLEDGAISDALSEDLSEEEVDAMLALAAHEEADEEAGGHSASPPPHRRHLQPPPQPPATSAARLGHESHGPAATAATASTRDEDEAALDWLLEDVVDGRSVDGRGSGLGRIPAPGTGVGASPTFSPPTPRAAFGGASKLLLSASGSASRGAGSTLRAFATATGGVDDPSSGSEALASSEDDRFSGSDSEAHSPCVLHYAMAPAAANAGSAAAWAAVKKVVPAPLLPTAGALAYTFAASAKGLASGNLELSITAGVSSGGAHAIAGVVAGGLQAQRLGTVASEGEVLDALSLAVFEESLMPFDEEGFVSALFVEHADTGAL